MKINFNQQQRSSQQKELPPEGWHNARIYEVRDEKSRKGDQMKQVIFELDGGDKVTDNLVLKPSVHWKIHNLLLATGIMEEEDDSIELSNNWSELINKRCQVKVEHNTYKGNKIADVSSYAPIKQNNSQQQVDKQKEQLKKDKKMDDDIPVVEDDNTPSF